MPEPSLTFDLMDFGDNTLDGSVFGAGVGSMTEEQIEQSIHEDELLDTGVVAAVKVRKRKAARRGPPI